MRVDHATFLLIMSRAPLRVAFFYAQAKVAEAESRLRLLQEQKRLRRAYKRELAALHEALFKAETAKKSSNSKNKASRTLQPCGEHQTLEQNRVTQPTAAISVVALPVGLAGRDVTKEGETYQFLEAKSLAAEDEDGVGLLVRMALLRARFDVSGRGGGRGGNGRGAGRASLRPYAELLWREVAGLRRSGGLIVDSGRIGEDAVSR